MKRRTPHRVTSSIASATMPPLIFDVPCSRSRKTTGTSVMGMLPLALVPGPGSAIYRGLAVIIVGGVLVSTIFTLVLLPALIQLGGARKDRPTDQGPTPRYVGTPVLEPAE